MHIYQPPSKKKGRKKKIRLVSTTPAQNIYQPMNAGDNTDLVILTHDELEALKIKNINGKNIVQGAFQMGIGKSTFANIYNSAVKKITEAIIGGKVLYIETAQQYAFSEPII